MAKDRTWLAKVTNAVSQHWQQKNLRKMECETGQAVQTF